MGGFTRGLPPSPAAGQFTGGDWHTQPQNWAVQIEPKLTVSPRPQVDPTGAPTGFSLSPAQAALAQRLEAGESGGDWLSASTGATGGMKLSEPGEQGATPLPPSDPEEWNPFGAGAPPPPPPPAAPAKPSPKPSSSSSTSSSGPPAGLIALGALALLALLLS